MNISKGGTGNAGLAKVELNPNKPIVRVTVQPEKEGENPKIYILNQENCPSYVQNGQFYVRLNQDGTKMYSMIPGEPGVFELKFKEFAHQKDKEPAPTTKQGNGQSGAYSYQTFTALFEIQEGPYKGMIVPGYYSYNFQPERIGEKEFVQISKPKSRFTGKLVEFMTVTGLIKQDIPWRENLLPGFQRFILTKDPKFSGMVKEGRIESLY